METVMMQDDFPHFGSTASHFAIFEDAKGARKEIQTGAACGDWADVSSARWGLAAQAPAFAEQFPKAFRLSSKNLAIKLWAEEGGKELDYRTPQIIKNYFGNDWIPENHEVTKVANTARGTAKTHEMWLYPHKGALDSRIIEQFGATREEIFASADPAWIGQTAVMGPWHPKDTTRFPEVEEGIEDYFNRTVLAGQKVFPVNGYLYWGLYPYSCQPWEVKNGRFYPKIHRLSRALEYNLKRAMWVLYARSADRKYYDYARRYTRLHGNLLLSNWDSGCKPKGWFIQGEFHSPIIWGAFGEEVIKADTRPDNPIHEQACIGYGTSEDSIQYAYDYLLTGDFHSRDAGLAYKQAIIDEMKFDVEKALKVVPINVFLRPMGSIYELDRDPRIYDFGHRILERVVGRNEDEVTNPAIAQNYVKPGDTFAVFYHYYISTQDELARKPLRALADFFYRNDRMDFLGRGSMGFPAFAYAWWQTKDPIYARYLAHELKQFGHGFPTLKRMGIDFESLGPKTTTPFGNDTMTGINPISIGLPVAMSVLAENPGPHPFVPFAAKPHPTNRTYLLFKRETAETATVDVYVNNVGHRSIQPRWLDASGKEVAVNILKKTEHRAPPATGEKLWQANWNIWYNAHPETHLHYRFEIPASVPPGIYQLDVGSEVRFTVLNSSILKMCQVAPDGLPLLPQMRSYFRVPADCQTLTFTATESVKIYDPDGKEVPLTRKGKSTEYEGPIGGRAGAWSLEAEKDVFVRWADIPMVIALGDPGRLFEPDLKAYPSTKAIGLPTCDPKNPYVEGKFGEGVCLSQQFIEVTTSPDPSTSPHQQGTVEFWFRPLWSVTDLVAARLELFNLNPLNLAQHWDSPFAAKFVMNFPKVIEYPAQTAFEAGKWYHLAGTWNVDGKNSEANLYINGRKRTYFDYHDGIPKDLPPAKLLPPGDKMRLGSGSLVGKTPGEVFDELRVSRTIRYTDDFEPATKPFEADQDTYLLMHLDGNIEGVLNQKPVTGQFIKGSKLW
ncbi:MAG: hypothetical protein HY360_06480 [Verrucomicrobia bacterium]|nr:hypothetical protein [Verrucomicrobiota bacterium]